jgi:hypothetical protein
MRLTRTALSTVRPFCDGSFLADLKRRFGGRGFELRTVSNEPIDLAPF